MTSIRIIGVSQIVLMEIPDALFNISFNSIMRRNSNNEIGGTFVAMFVSIYYLGKYLPTTILLLLMHFTGINFAMVISLVYSIGFYQIVVGKMVKYQSFTKE